METSSPVFSDSETASPVAESSEVHLASSPHPNAPLDSPTSEESTSSATVILPTNREQSSFDSASSRVGFSPTTAEQSLEIAVTSSDSTADLHTTSPEQSLEMTVSGSLVRTPERSPLPVETPSSSAEQTLDTTVTFHDISVSAESDGLYGRAPTDSTGDGGTEGSVSVGLAIGAASGGLALIAIVVAVYRVRAVKQKSSISEDVVSSSYGGIDFATVLDFEMENPMTCLAVDEVFLCWE
jgi:hypothetical protein